MKDPFRIWVVWTEMEGDPPETIYGRRLAETLAKRLGLIGMQRDGIGMRVPVFVRWHRWAARGMSPRPIDLTTADCNLIVIVQDDVMSDRSNGWANWVKELCETADPARDLITVINTGERLTRFPQLKDTQAFKPTSKEIRNQRFDRMILLLLGAMLTSGCADGMAGPRGSKATPFTIFLSHAKRDGEHLTRAFLDYRERCNRLNEEIASITFFYDRQSLMGSRNSRADLEACAKNDALVAIATDAYHDRVWCNAEFLWAKEAGNAIVVVDATSAGTLRSFPYLGNVPLVHLPHTEQISDSAIEKILALSLAEALRIRIFRHHAAKLDPQLQQKTVRIGIRPPELVELAQIARSKAKIDTLVYPDPPVNDHERSLIEAAMPGLKLTSLGEFLGGGAADNAARPFAGKLIGISVSDTPASDRDALGLSNFVEAGSTDEMDRALATILTPLIRGGATIAYGGRIDVGNRPNYTLALSEDLAAAYRSVDPEVQADGGASGSAQGWANARPFQHYLRCHDRLPRDRIAHQVFDHVLRLGTHATVQLLDGSEIALSLEARTDPILEPPDKPPVILKTAFTQRAIASPEALASDGTAGPVLEKPTRPAAALRGLQEALARDCHARIVIGGRVASKSGASGVAQETLMSIERNHHVLVLGGFGGAALDIAVALGLTALPPGFERPESSHRNEEGKDVSRQYRQSIGVLTAHRDAYLDRLARAGVLEEAKLLAGTDSAFAAGILVDRILRKLFSGGTS